MPRDGNVVAYMVYQCTITSIYVDSNTFTMGIGQPYARVDLNSPVRDLGFVLSCEKAL